MNRSVLRAFELKAVDDAARTFEGIAAAYSLDQGGDIIVPGAFDQTLKDWRKRDGKVIPLIDSHRRDTVTAIVGKMTDAKEVKDGLWTKHELLPAGDQAADAIHNRLKAGVVAGMSIGYQPVEVKQPTPEEQRGGIWRYLKAVKLKHNALVSDPMNEDAVVDLESVKGLLLKTSRRGISADELEQMESLIAALSARVAAAKASAAEPVKCPQCGGMVVPTEAARL